MSEEMKCLEKRLSHRPVEDRSCDAIEGVWKKAASW